MTIRENLNLAKEYIDAALAELGDGEPEPEPDPDPGLGDYIWISPDQIRSLPQSGPAWDRVVQAAAEEPDTRWITDQHSDLSNQVLARALVGTALGEDGAHDAARLLDQMTEEWDTNENTLGIARNLASAVIAADILDHRSASFVSWVEQMCGHTFSDGRSILTVHQSRPNNWGTHAGASRVAAEIYIDGSPSTDSINIHRAWMGDYESWPNFTADWGIGNHDISWQADPDRPVGINPTDTKIKGKPVGGVVPDDQRRTGFFTWPPPSGEEYVLNSLAAAACTTQMLAVWELENRAIHRAIEWLDTYAGFTAEKASWDGAWIASFFVGGAVPGNDHPTRRGLADTIDFVDWTHGVIP